MVSRELGVKALARLFWEKLGLLVDTMRGFVSLRDRIVMRESLNPW